VNWPLGDALEGERAQRGEEDREGLFYHRDAENAEFRIF
jgi:hypothetical protein